MRKEAPITEFKILENIKGNAEKYPYDPVISVCSQHASISRLGQEKLQIKKSDSVAFSTRNDTVYFAILPLDSKIRGYTVHNIERSKNFLYISSAGVVKRGISLGVYLIKDPVFAGGIDWYELEKINELLW